MAMDSGHAQLRQQIQIPSFAFSGPSNKYAREVQPPRPSPVVTMSAASMPPKTETMSAPQGVWTTPATQGMRPRPATIHEGFSYCMAGGFEGVPAWDSSSLQMQQPPPDSMTSRPMPVHQEYYPVTTMESNTWAQKPCDDTLEIAGLENDMSIGQAYTTDEAIPILDLRYQGPPMDGDSLPYDNGLQHPRRMSGSSFTVSTSGGLSDMPSYEDFSAALSDAPSFSSEYPPPSNRNSLMSSTQLSPVASPRMTPQGRSELVRTQSRGRGASPSPRPGMRAAPYSVESARNKRWSTGSYGTAQNRRPSPFVYHHPHDAFNPHARMSSRHSSPTIAHGQLPLNFGNLQAAQQHPYLLSNAPAFHRNSMLLPSQLPSHGFHHDMHHQYENPPPLLSHGLFRMLQSNADPHSLHSHYTDLSDPPDLYASLHEEQIPPPPEDMNPTDQDLVPHEQELRFDGDLYTPRWVRGHGNKREGWCGICKPGRWLVLKNSAFWYDKSFTHGISAATGSPFQEPQETRRMDGNPDVWEGLCGSCNEWIALVSSKKKGTTWFRHAYKCHTHPKIKDAPKRRRESSHSRNLAASTMAKPKTEPLTPQMTPAASVANTPTPAQAQMQSQSQAPPQPTSVSPQEQQPPQAVQQAPSPQEQQPPASLQQHQAHQLQRQQQHQAHQQHQAQHQHQAHQQQQPEQQTQQQLHQQQHQIIQHHQQLQQQQQQQQQQQHMQLQHPPPSPHHPHDHHHSHNHHQHQQHHHLDHQHQQHQHQQQQHHQHQHPLQQHPRQHQQPPPPPPPFHLQVTTAPPQPPTRGGVAIAPPPAMEAYPNMI